MNTFKTYILSLESDLARREWMKSIQPKIGLEFNFFNAITPANLSTEDKNRFKHADFYEWNINHDAVMATFMSHLTLLRECVNSDTNMLIIEDDIDIVRSLDWNSIDFVEFDVWNLTAQPVSCFAYFVSVDGATKILEYINQTVITQAYDWELSKLEDRLNFKKETTPVFIQLENKFVSNIAPNGYERRKDS